MARELKEIIVADFKGRFEKMTDCVLIDYQGLDAEKTVDLRNALRENGIRMTVIRNRLARLAFGARGDLPEAFSEFLRGPTAVLHGEDGVLTASKTLAGWQKKNKDLVTVKGGLLEGRLMSEADIDELAKIPDRETLQAQVAATFVSPLQSLVSAASQLLSHLAGCAKARHEELGGGSGEEG